MRPSAVVDASILVSAFLFPAGVPGEIVTMAGSGAFAMHLSPILIEETRRSLNSPRLRKTYGYAVEAVLTWCAQLASTGLVFTGLQPDFRPVCRDPDDDHGLATAVAVHADAIVTGDKDLLTLGQYRTIRIVTDRAFLDELRASA